MSAVQILRTVSLDPQEERAAQFNNPQSPFSREALGTPNERFPFIYEPEPRQPGEMPRTPSMLERMFAALKSAWETVVVYPCHDHLAEVDREAS